VKEESTTTEPLARASSVTEFGSVYSPLTPAFAPDFSTFHSLRRGRDLVLVAELQSINRAQDFGERTADGSGVGEGETDLLGRVDCGLV